MSTFALLNEQSVVINLVVGDSAESFPGHTAVLVPDNAIPLMGWVYSAQSGFADPNPPPAPPEPTGPAVPESVSRFQARVALYQAGYLQTIDTYMALADTPVLSKLAWQDAQEFRRKSPTVLALAQMLGLTETQLDDLFIFASKVKA
jgi:hypothetical protein